jgi:hypothetical protein
LTSSRVDTTVIPDDLIVEIRDLEKKLTCPFNRKLAHLLVLTFNDGFVVLLTELMSTDFDGDWFRLSHRCESGKRKPYVNTIQYLHNNKHFHISVVDSWI